MDDIFDKLDSQRVTQIIQLVSGEKFGQIFITDTNREHLDELLKQINNPYKIFTVKENGINETFDMTVHPSRKGMFDGKTKEEIRDEKSKVLKQMKALEDDGKKVPKHLRTKIAQINFALRAKNNWKKAK